MNTISKLTTPTETSAGSRGATSTPGVFQRIFLKSLEGFTLGNLQLVFPDGSRTAIGGDSDSPRARIEIRNRDFFRKCVLYGGVGMGESWMDGDWKTDDLRRVFEWFVLNLHADKKLRGSAQRFRLLGWLRLANRLRHLTRPNSRKTSRRNIADHYDLGNDFYRLWLDSSMTYSCGKFTREGQSLEEAQETKYEALCRKLRLSADDHVLEIGCGWGGFCCYAAKHYGCRVTAITISKEQLDEACRRVEEAGLSSLVEIRLQDYRDIEGQFDKIVSIEMLEAVGDRFLETWCARCGEILKPHGLLAVQMITVPDCDHRELKKGTDFIQKHIFPGSLLLSTGRMNEALNKTGNLFLHSMEDLGSCYVRTLKTWHRNFNEHIGEIKKLGYSSRFIRKWNYYLQYCEAAFATRNISVVQAVYTRPCNLSLHREDGIIHGIRN